MTNNFESEEREQWRIQMFHQQQIDYVNHKLKILENDIISQSPEDDCVIKSHLIKALFYIDFDLQQLIKIMEKNKS